MVNGRITVEQMDWLQERADELGGNLSAALRQAVTDARFLEMARDDYRSLRAQHPEFKIPRHEDDGSSSFLEVILGMGMSDTDDLQWRREQSTDEAS